eukprot:scaffold80353_cov63-Phaeocystis_antarctica.AAC.1
MGAGFARVVTPCRTGSAGRPAWPCAPGSWPRPSTRTRRSSACPSAAGPARGCPAPAAAAAPRQRQRHSSPPPRAAATPLAPPLRPCRLITYRTRRACAAAAQGCCSAAAARPRASRAAHHPGRRVARAPRAGSADSAVVGAGLCNAGVGGGGLQSRRRLRRRLAHRGGLGMREDAPHDVTDPRLRPRGEEGVNDQPMPLQQTRRDRRSEWSRREPSNATGGARRPAG